MKAFFYSAALAATASAAVLRRDQCSFQITATGDVSGVMGQLTDGQNRVNGSYTPVTYRYNNGGIIDATGRGCIVTMDNDATHQFQCDLGKAPTYGFSIAGNGSILYQGNDQFYACPATDTEYNVYTQWLKGQDKCKPIKLSTNGSCANASPSGGFAAPSGNVPGYSVPTGTSVGAVVPGYTSIQQQPTPGIYGSASIPAYGYTSQGSVAAYTPQPSAPGYQPASEQSIPGYEVSVPIVPGYGSETSVPSYGVPSQASVPGYSSEATYVASSAPEVTLPAYSTAQISVPGFSSATEATVPVDTATAPGYESASVPGYGQASVPGYGQASIPGYGQESQSVPAQSGVVYSTQTVWTTPCVATYSGEGPSSTQWAATEETTAWNAPSSSAEVPGETATAPAYGAPSQSAPSYETSSQETVLSYSSASQPSVPGYSQETNSGPAPPTYGASSTSEAPSVPAFTAPSQSAPGYETSSQTTAPAYSSQASVPGYGVPGYGSSQASVPGYTSAASTAVASSYAQPSGSQPATSSLGSACQTSLTGAYQTPHLIVPISSSSPDTAAGTQYNGTINEDTSTIFNFDIPADYEGKTCTVIFLFPKQEDLETSAYTFSGSGSIEFSELSGVATEATTYNNAPEKSDTLNTIAIQSGTSYVVSTGACAAGSALSYELSSENGLSLEFFEDWNPSPLGLYITAC